MVIVRCNRNKCEGCQALTNRQCYLLIQAYTRQGDLFEEPSTVECSNLIAGNFLLSGHFLGTLSQLSSDSGSHVFSSMLFSVLSFVPQIGFHSFLKEVITVTN